jgi:hypothetical protein
VYIALDMLVQFVDIIDLCLFREIKDSCLVKMNHLLSGMFRPDHVIKKNSALALGEKAGRNSYSPSK